MTGSHEVRGSIPLGSTNTLNNLKPPIGGPIGGPKSFDGLLTATLTATRWESTSFDEVVGNHRVRSTLTFR